MIRQSCGRTPGSVFGPEQTDASIALTLDSPRGGQAPIEPKGNEPDAQTTATERFNQTLLPSKPWGIPTAKATDFDAISYPSGHGSLWDLTEDQQFISLLKAAYAAGRLDLA